MDWSNAEYLVSEKSTSRVEEMKGWLWKMF